MTTEKEKALTEGQEDGLCLTDQDLHCIARLLQSTVFADDLFFGCRFCKYECLKKTGEPLKNYNIVMKKLQRITGVDTSPVCNGRSALFQQDISKFLKASNHSIKKELAGMLGLE